jgi:hypothetical protein
LKNGWERTSRYQLLWNILWRIRVPAYCRAWPRLLRGRRNHAHGV